MEQFTSYSFRKSAFTQNQYWTLSDIGLYVQEEKQVDMFIRYDQILSIKLTYEPGRFKLNNHNCKISSQLGTLNLSSSSYRSIGNFIDQGPDYSNFIREFIKRLETVNPSIFIDSKSSNQSNYLMMGVFILLILFLLQSFNQLTFNLSASANLKIGILLISAFILIKTYKRKTPHNNSNEGKNTLVLPN